MTSSRQENEGNAGMKTLKLSIALVMAIGVVVPLPKTATAGDRPSRLSSTVKATRAAGDVTAAI